MSSQAVWIRSLTSLPLLTDFLKHSSNLSSVKGHPPLKRKKTRAVTKQQENFTTSASSGRVYQILFTPPSHKKRLTLLELYGKWTEIRDYFRNAIDFFFFGSFTGNLVKICFPKQSESWYYVQSGKLPTYPSPKPTFCAKSEVSVNAGLTEG